MAASRPRRPTLREAVLRFGGSIAAVPGREPSGWETADADPGTHPAANAQSSISLRYVTAGEPPMVVTTMRWHPDKAAQDVAGERILSSMLERDPDLVHDLAPAVKHLNSIAVSDAQHPIVLDGTALPTRQFSADGIVVLIAEQRPAIAFTGTRAPPLILWNGSTETR